MFAVIFEVSPRPERFGDYLDRAGVLRPEIQAIDGFILNQRYRSLSRPAWLVSLSLWRDEKSLVRWRTHALHHEFQAEGRARIFADYHLRVGEIVSGDLPGQRFDATEVSAEKALSVTACPVGEAPAFGGEGFDSITEPGNGLFLRSWADTETAAAGVAGVAGDHRVLRVIRDYGMFQRAEAPQRFAV
jgi:heme-degrading monooxygenase HmoA